MDKGNTVSGHIPDEQFNGIIQDVRDMRDSIPCAVPLTTEDKQHLVKPGDSGLEAAEVALVVLEKHPHLFPTAIFNAQELRSDLRLAGQMKHLASEIRSLLSIVEDTGMAAASDAYRAGLRIYAMATKMADLVPGLSTDIAKFEEHTDRPARKSTTESETQSDNQ